MTISLPPGQPITLNLDHYTLLFVTGNWASNERQAFRITMCIVLRQIWVSKHSFAFALGTDKYGQQYVYSFARTLAQARGWLDHVAITSLGVGRAIDVGSWLLHGLRTLSMGI